MSTEANKALIRRYYDHLWNQWDPSIADEIIDHNIMFRGSLGLTTRGLEGFKDYVATVRAAFPDFHNTVEELIAEGDKVVARLTYRGTHQGELFGAAPTGKRVTYSGIAIFHISRGKVVDGWVSADTWGLAQQLGVIPARPLSPDQAPDC